MEKVFYSRVTIRILFHLMKNEMETETRLMKIARVNYSNFLKHLKKLIEIGVITRVNLGRIIVISLNKESTFYMNIRGTYDIWCKKLD